MARRDGQVLVAVVESDRGMTELVTGLKLLGRQDGLVAQTTAAPLAASVVQDRWPVGMVVSRGGAGWTRRDVERVREAQAICDEWLEVEV